MNHMKPHNNWRRCLVAKGSVEEFLASGGKIEQVPFGKRKYKEDWEPWEKPDGGFTYKVLQDIRKNRRKARGLS